MLQTKTDTSANSVDLDETAHMSRLIRIYTICHSVFDFRLKPLFASMDVTKFKDGKVHVRNSGVKELMKFSISNRYEVEGCEVIWAIRAGSITSTFVDRGAATFFLPHLNEEKDQKDKPMKRLKYTVDGKQHNKWCINFGTISSHVLIFYK